MIPFVPVRYFVLSFRYRLRYLLAYDHERHIGVLRIVIRAVLGFYNQRARARGTSGGRLALLDSIQLDAGSGVILERVDDPTADETTNAFNENALGSGVRKWFSRVRRRSAD